MNGTISAKGKASCKSYFIKKEMFALMTVVIHQMMEKSNLTCHIHKHVVLSSILFILKSWFIIKLNWHNSWSKLVLKQHRLKYNTYISRTLSYKNTENKATQTKFWLNRSAEFRTTHANYKRKTDHKIFGLLHYGNVFRNSNTVSITHFNLTFWFILSPDS